MTTTYHLSFRSWLLVRRDGRGPVAHLAADVADDEKFPRSGALGTYLGYLRSVHASSEAVDVLREAWHLFCAETGREELPPVDRVARAAAARLLSGWLEQLPTWEPWEIARVLGEVADGAGLDDLECEADSPLVTTVHRDITALLAELRKRLEREAL